MGGRWLRKTAALKQNGDRWTPYSLHFLRTLIKILVPLIFLYCFHLKHVTFQSVILNFCAQLVDVISKTNKTWVGALPFRTTLFIHTASFILRDSSVLLSSIFTCSMVFACMHKAQLPFVLLRDVSL